MELFTVLNVLLMLWPSVVTIEMHATRISASMTAYSTAVGPSSLVKNREIERSERDMTVILPEMVKAKRRASCTLP